MFMNCMRTRKWSCEKNNIIIDLIVEGTHTHTHTHNDTITWRQKLCERKIKHGFISLHSN